jgi:hypothetical protein
LPAPLAVLFCTLYQIYIKCGTLLETSLSCGVPAFAEIQVPPHKIRLSDGKTMDAWLDRVSDSLEIAQTASMIFCSGWPRSAGLLARSDDAHAMPRGCPAEPYEHNLDPTCTPTQVMHIDPTRTIHRHSFVQRFSQILSE